MSIVMEYASQNMHIGETSDILVLIVSWKTTSLIKRVSSFGMERFVES